jgi:RNA polymerase sigma-70 factor (ECF subfamily)
MEVPLLQFLRRLGRDCDAEDVLQETFMRAHSRLDQYQPSWKFSTWLFTIARRTSINYHRRPRPLADDEAIRHAVSPAAGPDQIIMEADNRQYLWSAAARILGEDEQAAMWLHYVEEMSVGEIAAVLDRSTVAVKTMMFRARQKLLPLLRDLQHAGQTNRPTSPVEASHG